MGQRLFDYRWVFSGRPLKPLPHFSEITSFYEYVKGTGVTEALIYLWKYDDKIVVSDIDGTVTRSDVVGHISNVLYIDYTHSGIHNLYDQIQR